MWLIQAPFAIGSNCLQAVLRAGGWLSALLTRRDFEIGLRFVVLPDELMFFMPAVLGKGDQPEWLQRSCQCYCCSHHLGLTHLLAVTQARQAL